VRRVSGVRQTTLRQFTSSCFFAFLIELSGLSGGALDLLCRLPNAVSGLACFVAVDEFAFDNLQPNHFLNGFRFDLEFREGTAQFAADSSHHGFRHKGLGYGEGIEQLALLVEGADCVCRKAFAG
jgi:hypothetical protein